MNIRRTAYQSATLVALIGYASCLHSPAIIQVPGAFAQDAASQGRIAVLLNGAPINFGGVPPAQIGGRIMVPLRGVFEALGATVDFDPVNSTIFAVRGETQVQLRLGSTEASVNGVARTLDVPAQARTGRTFVPLRFVSEALGAEVLWSDALRTVYITTPGGVSPATPTTPTLPAVPTPPAVPAPTPEPPQPPYVPPADVTRVTGTIAKLDATPPATLTLRTDNRLRTFQVSDDVQLFRQTAPVIAAGATPAYTPATPLADLGRLVPNEEVRVQLDDQNNVTRITSLVMLATARVRYAQDNQIVLEDARGTTLTIGPNLRFVDARNRSVTTANVQAGQSVTLFIAPGTRRIYQVSASNADNNGTNNPTYNAPDDGNPTYPNNGSPNNGNPNNGNPNNGNPNNGNPNGAGAPVINLVTHNAPRALRTGATVTVTVRGTAGARGSFTVIPGAPEQPLDEDNNQPGVYTGTYAIRPGDNVLNGRVTAYLRNDAGQEAVLQSRLPLTIDTVAPRITSVSPTNGATVNTEQPNIVVATNDIGGSGIARATAFINNVAVPAESIVISPTSVTILPAQLLTGLTTVRVAVADAANNSVGQTWSFTVNANGGDQNTQITAVTHNATRAMAAGERVTVNVVAPEGGRVTFDVLGANERVVAQRLPMTEITPGRFRGYYTIPQNAQDTELFIRARLTDVDGHTETADATASIVLADAENIEPVTITVPADGDHVTSPLTIRGHGSPNATVEVSVRAEGVRYFIFEYKNELGTQQLQATNRGDWSTTPIDLPKPNNVSNLKYVITAVQVDAAGRRSDPVTVTVDSR